MICFNILVTMVEFLGHGLSVGITGHVGVPTLKHES